MCIKNCFHLLPNLISGNLRHVDPEYDMHFSEESSVWKEIQSLPVTGSTLATLGDHLLLLVGGVTQGVPLLDMTPRLTHGMSLVR